MQSASCLALLSFFKFFSFQKKTYFLKEVQSYASFVMEIKKLLLILLTRRVLSGFDVSVSVSFDNKNTTVSTSNLLVTQPNQ